jgi:hypothetical protein
MGSLVLSSGCLLLALVVDMSCYHNGLLSIQWVGDLTVVDLWAVVSSGVGV